MKKIYLLFITVLSFSCVDSEFDDFTPVNYDAENETQIQTYLAENELTFEKTASGLYYTITEEGEGNMPIASSNTTLGYKGYFLNETVFDASENTTFNLTGGVIPGFSEGVQLLKEGGAGTFILPSRLAYGNQGSGPIAPGDVIIFDINLISVN